MSHDRNMIPISAAGGELLICVFNHLNRKDWYTAEKVCTWWHFLLNDCWYQAHTLHASTVAKFCNRKLANFIARRQFYLNPMIAFRYKYSKSNTKPFNFEDIMEIAPCLRYLNLKGYELCMIDSFFANSLLRNLKELTLRVGVFVQCRQIEQLLALNRYLAEFCLIGHYCREENTCLLIMPRHLDVLTYQRCHMWFQGLDTIFSRWYNVQYLRIDICDNVTNEFIDIAFEYLPLLKGFSCNFVKQDEKTQTEPYTNPNRILQKKSQISIITLINNCLFNDAMLSTVIENCVKLEHLYVGFLPFEADFGSNFRSTQKTEYKMDITRVVTLHHTTLNKIQTLKHLRNLCLYGVTSECLHSFDAIACCQTLEVLAVVSVYFDVFSESDKKNEKKKIGIYPKLSFERFICKCIIKITTLYRVVFLGQKISQRCLEIAKSVIISDDDIMRGSDEQPRKKEFTLEIEKESFTPEQLSMYRHPRFNIIQTTVPEFVNRWETAFFSSLILS